MPRKHGEFQSVRHAILATASRLFTQNGVHGTSLNDIAAAAGLSKGTLYYYYPAKEQLVLDIANQSIAFVTDTLFAWVDSLERQEGLRSAILRLVDALTADEHAMRLHAVLCAEATGQLQQQLASAYHEWTVMLEVGSLKLKSQTSRQVHAKSQLFFAALDGYMLQYPAGLTDMDKHLIVDLLFGQQ